MIVLLRKYWKQIALFGIISAVYINCTTPGMTWSGFDCDLGDFLFAAKYGTIIHFPGFPVYGMLAWLAVRIPIGGSDSFRLAFFLSTIPAIITCVLVYLAVKKQTANKWAPYVGTLALAGANIFIMQSIIPEVYVFTALMVTASYTALVYGKFRIAAIFGGLTCAMHWMAAPAIIGFFLISKEFRRKWKYIILSFGIPYIYTVIMANANPSYHLTNQSTVGLLQYAFGTLSDNMQWWLDLPIWQVPGKILTTIVLFCVAFGLSLIPMIKYLCDWRKSALLLVAIVIPLLYFFGCVAGLTIVHPVVCLPFLAIAAGLGIDNVRRISPKFICATSFVLLCLLPLNFDIGRTLDKNMSTESFYRSFDSVSDHDIVIDIGKLYNVTTNISLVGSREDTLLKLYNDNENRDIISIDIVAYCGIGRVYNYSDKETENYRNSLINDYNMSTPFSVDASIGLTELYWKNVDLIAKANPDRRVFYIMLFENDPFMRELVQYEYEN